MLNRGFRPFNKNVIHSSANCFSLCANEESKDEGGVRSFDHLKRPNPKIGNFMRIPTPNHVQDVSSGDEENQNPNHNSMMITTTAWRPRKKRKSAAAADQSNYESSSQISKKSSCTTRLFGKATKLLNSSPGGYFGTQ